MRRPIAAALLLTPHAAWAHGDHAGTGGIHHVLTSPEHLGVLLLVGAVLAILRNGSQRKNRPASGCARNDTA